MRLESLLFLILVSSLTVAAQANRPVLFSQPDSTRAIAFESPLFTTEPFSPDSPFPWGSDRRTRVMLFAQNLTLAAGEDLSNITADAEDGQHHLFNLKVEYLGTVPGQEWLTAVVLRLNDDLDDVGDVLVRVTYHGLSSNRVRIGIGHVGGGLPDDPGSTPTPAPPYLISGRLTINGAGFINVPVALGGTQTASTKTDDSGAYSFTVNRAGNYTITPSLAFYDFSPQSIAIDNLTTNRTGVNFTASRSTFSISGQLRDVDSSGIAGISITLVGGEDSSTQTVVTGAQGDYSFPQIKAGYSYTITPASNQIFTFTPQTIDILTTNSKLDFQATRRTYSLGGRVMEGTKPLSGATIALSGWTSSTTVTDADGSYVFTNIEAGRNYKLTPSKTYFQFVPQSQAVESLVSNQTIDFNGTATYHLSGRLTDQQGRAAAGVTITLAGPENAVTEANSEGNYSFIVHSGGSYTLNPESNAVFIFSPQTIPNLASDLQLDVSGTRRKYSIKGKLTGLDSLSLPGISVVLSGNSAEQVGTADEQGAFSFSEVEAGFTYTITSAGNRVFSFSPFVISTLISDLQTDIPAIRRTYYITGRVLEGTTPLGGVTVTLSGGISATTTTGSDGLYGFTDIPAGLDYIVTPAKAPYTFEPSAQSTTYFQGYQNIDFTATANYRLTGRVTDENGKSLGGVTVRATGVGAAETQTLIDGTYTLIVHTAGDYNLTAAQDQNFYTFSPAVQPLANVNADRSADFHGTLSLTTDPSQVLEFDGTPMTVDCGPFWNAFQPLGDFFWEVWAAPGENASGTYMISDGYGGAHAVLFGFAHYGEREPNRYQLFGDLWDGSNFVFFSSDEGPAVGEWGHYAVGWDRRQIITYFNGVPVGRVAYSGPRISPGPNWGAGRLLIGGSDHNNLVGRIAQVRGYEERNPRADVSVTAAFAPESVFSREGNFLSYFFRPSQKIADMSPSYYMGQVHTGRLRGTLFPYGLLFECPDCPLPKFVVDPTAPKFLNSPVNTSAPVDANPTAAENALIFDSFSRANSTYAMGIGGLGSTEGANNGQKPWQTVQTSTGLEPFGLLNGRAVMLANQTAMAWVQTGSANGNLDIHVKRHAGEAGSGLDTGIAFRVVDNQNYFFAYTSGDENAPATSRKLTVGYYLSGVRTELVSNLSLAGKWTELQVRTHSNGQLTVSIDGEMVYSAGSSVMASATGAGLYSNGPGAGLLNRWDDFAVYNLP